MEKSRKRACQFIGLFGVLAVGTSITAEFTRTKKEEVRYGPRGCSVPGSPALPLGITAAISLSIAQLTANIMGGCVCRCARNPNTIPSPHRLTGIVCLILSWTSFVFAMYLLIAGSVLNQRQQQWSDNECYAVKAGVLGGAGALSFATTVFVMIYYALIRGSEAEEHSWMVVVPMATPPSPLNSGNSSSRAAVGLGIEPSPPVDYAKH